MKNYIRKIKIFAFLTICLELTSCNSRPRKDDLIARVNGEPITVGEYQNLYETLKPKELSRSGREAAEIKNLVIKTLVRRHVVLTEAKRRNVSVSEDELQSAIAKFKEGYPQDTFREEFLDQMLDEQDWKSQIEENIIIEKIFDLTETRKPTPRITEALEFYEKNSALFHRPAEATALHIVVNEKNIADEIRKKLESRPGQFLELAKQYSIGPEASEGAKINIEKNTLTEELDKALFETSLQKITPVIQSQYGFHILKVIDRKPPLNKDFDEAKGEIMKKLEAEQRKTWLLRLEEDLLRSAQIEYNRDLVKKL